ncbi:MAG: hypothetical protein K0R37_2127, partial [Arthrobacter sp.]|nr:hypothetical protein [Arthrobacter sp.]
MNHLPAARTYREQQAGSLQTGDHLLLPDGLRSAEIHSVDVENDDFGVPALVLATLTGGGMLRIAAGSSVRLTDPVEAASVAAGPAAQTGAEEDRTGKDSPGRNNGQADSARQA